MGRRRRGGRWLSQQRHVDEDSGLGRPSYLTSQHLLSSISQRFAVHPVAEEKQLRNTRDSSFLSARFASTGQQHGAQMSPHLLFASNGHGSLQLAALENASFEHFRRGAASVV
jgi:hypothetical protein